MTVSDWGSAVSPFGSSGGVQGRVGQGAVAQGSVGQGSVGQGSVGQGPSGQGAPQSFPDPAAPQGPADAQARAPAQHGPAPDAGGPGYGDDGPYAQTAHAAYAPHPPQAHQPTDRPAGSDPRGAAGWLNAAGALVSLALIVGLGIWGYQLALRDVTGVPVVKALDGPMRDQPAEPGGSVAPHQGLAVNDVAAAAEIGGPVEQLALAPPAETLAEEDVPAHAVAEVTAAPMRPAAAPLPRSGGEINADAAVAEALGLTDIPGLDGGLDAPPEPGAAAASGPIPASVPGVSRSPRPMPRPASISGLPAASATVAVVNAVDVSARPAALPEDAARPAAVPANVVLGQEIAPEALAANTRLVQLDAHPDPAAARAHWLYLADRNPGLFESRNWTIVTGSSGGKTFYRLRAIGFAGLDAARAFCAALVTDKGTCVPVVEG